MKYILEGIIIGGSIIALVITVIFLISENNRSKEIANLIKEKQEKARYQYLFNEGDVQLNPELAECLNLCTQ